MINRVLCMVCVISFLTGCTIVYAQDTTTVDQQRRGLRQLNIFKRNKLARDLLGTVTRTPPVDTIPIYKSESMFLPYEGKIIRKILINRIGFERGLRDTTRSIRNTITKTANALHSNTKEWVIRDNIFFREYRPLNPYKLADNERHLRDLDFIVDATIYVLPLRSSADSVDILVMTRDVFSIGGRFSPRSPTRTTFSLYDVNVGGWGQRVDFNGIIDADRAPVFGSNVELRKNSVAGSLIDVSAGYTQLNNASSLGFENEYAAFLRMNRPLVSPYSRMAGGFELSRNWSRNIFLVPDSLFRNYSYHLTDIWTGYNVGARSLARSRSRHFLSARALFQRFIDKPLQNIERLNPVYNNQSFVLGQVTFFKQNFYKTQFIYGFGRTEDVPYGHTISILTGFESRLGLRRPYVGLDVDRTMVNRNGTFYTVSFRGGMFREGNVIQDATILTTASLFSRLIHYKRLLIRQSFNIGYTHMFNQTLNFPLNINNEVGLQGFSADSLLGTKRFIVGFETVAFTPYQFLGFNFAVFTFAEMAALAPEARDIWYDEPYFGLGAGVRTRNENLVFGTIELRLFYYPRTYGDLSSFRIRVSTNLRVKYTAGFVRPPSFVLYN